VIALHSLIKYAALAALCFAASVASANAETTLRIGDQKGNARSVLEAAGALAGAPYKIEWLEFPAAAPLLEAAGAGAIDAGAPIKAIEAMRSNQEGLAVVVERDSPLHQFKDLVGKKIATGRGSIGHQLVLAQLEANGLKPSDVQLAFLLPSDAAIALKTGSVDAWSTWDPYVAQMELGQGARRIVDGVGVTPGLAFFFARDDALADADKRAALQDLVARLAKARRWGLEHLESYAKSWSATVGLSTNVGLKVSSRAKYRATPIDDSVVADEQKTIDLYVRSGLIKGPLEAAKVVSPVFTAAIAAELTQ
jgi:sulfonate transport system substrate-binding protein